MFQNLVFTIFELDYVEADLSPYLVPQATVFPPLGLAMCLILLNGSLYGPFTGVYVYCVPLMGTEITTFCYVTLCNW